VTPVFNLADLWEIVAGAVPERLAVVAGDRRLTFGGLDERANRWADHPRATGIAPGDKVATLAWNRSEWVEAFFGAFKARAVPINVNQADYRWVKAQFDVHERGNGA
jgi:3-oxocholest-4-en-26-oate---CoA ligase